MIAFNEVTYTAIITLSLPGTAETASATVMLAPPDTIQVDGRTKALRDCTLADLQAFADRLESEVWETYEAIKLGELAENDEAVVKVTILNETGEPLPEQADWAQHLVLLAMPDGGLAVGDRAAGGTSADEPASEPAAAATDDSTPVAETEPEAMADSPAAVDKPAAADESAAESGAPSLVAEETEAEPGVTVAESEPVHPEREADPAAPAVVPTLPRIRIAGQRRPLGHPTWTAVDILINEPAFRDAQAHAITSMDREVAGVLVGPPPEKQPDGRYLVHVTDTIIAKHTRMHGASVTYTPESWRYLNDKLAELYPDETAVMVGWYHTHPGFGIFLSSMDQFIHRNFFTQVWHVALVLDPVARKSGFFCWNRAKSEVSPYEFPWPTWAFNSW